MGYEQLKTRSDIAAGLVGDDGLRPFVTVISCVGNTLVDVVFRLILGAASTTTVSIWSIMQCSHAELGVSTTGRRETTADLPVQNLVGVRSKQVVALVVALLCDHTQQCKVQRRMTLIPARLLALH